VAHLEAVRVEVSVPGAEQKGVPFGAGKDQRRAVGEPRVADRDAASRQSGHRYAIAARVAVLTLAPRDMLQRRRLHSVIRNVHRSSLHRCSARRKPRAGASQTGGWRLAVAERSVRLHLHVHAINGIVTDEQALMVSTGNGRVQT
jgi:hypothetical protein